MTKKYVARKKRVSKKSTTPNNNVHNNDNIKKLSRKRDIDDDNVDLELSDESENDSSDLDLFQNDINKTSNNTLSNMKLLEPSEILSIFNSLKEKHKEEKNALLQEVYDIPFYEMFNDLKMGHNILIYGVGSKINLLDSFINQQLVDGPNIVIEGFRPDFNIKSVLDCILYKLFEHKHIPFPNLLVQCEYIRMKFAEKAKYRNKIINVYNKRRNGDTIQNSSFNTSSQYDNSQMNISNTQMDISNSQFINNMTDTELSINAGNISNIGANNSTQPNTRNLATIISTLESNEEINDFFYYNSLYIVIHNIDGLVLRNPKIQKILGLLAEIPEIHIIATCDNLNVDILWDHHLETQFNWTRYSLPTYQTYDHEIMYEDSMLGSRSKSSKTHIRSVLMVLHSLTKEQVGTYKSLLDALVEQQKAPTKTACKLLSKQLYETCLDEFYLTSESTFKAYLVEFIDHKIIEKKTAGFEDYLTIPLPQTSYVQLQIGVNEIFEAKKLESK